MRSCKAVFSIFWLFLFLLFTVSSQASESVINDVQFHGENDGSESVVFFLSSTSLPKAFALKGEKPRVVFDFMDTQLAKTVPSVISCQGSMVDKIRMGRHSKKTRVVLDLTSTSVVNFDQDFDAERNVLTIHLYSTDYPPKEEAVIKEVVKTAVVKTVAEEPPVVEEEQQQKSEVRTAAAPATLENPLSPEVLLSEINFENTSNKGEMVLFKLNGFYPPDVSGEENGTPKVTCVFAGARMGADLVKEQTPHGKFIEKILVEQEDATAPVKVILELVPNKNYDLQQVFFKEDNLFVVIVNSYDVLDVPAE